VTPEHRAPPRPATAAVAPSTDQERAHIVRYTRPERWSILDRFPVSAAVCGEMLAEMLGWSADQVRSCVSALTTGVADTADAMLEDPTFRTALANLPFRTGDRIAAVGDSLTADRLGWFDLIVASMRGHGDLDVVTQNLGVSGSTTADALERFDILEAFRPTHVLMMLGTNDARRHGRLRSHRMVSPQETQRNLSALIDLVVNELSAQIIVITPPPADQTRISAFFTDSTTHRSHGIRRSAPQHRRTAGRGQGRRADPGRRSS
jgi:acyl-CoA thioesterase-1